MGSEYKAIIAKFPEAYYEAQSHGLEIASLQEVNEIIASKPELLNDKSCHICTGTIAGYLANQQSEPASIRLNTKRTIDKKATRVVLKTPVNNGIILLNLLISPGLYDFKQEGNKWIFSPKKGILMRDLAWGSEDFQFFWRNEGEIRELEEIVKTSQFRKRADSNYAGPVFTGGLYDRGVFSTNVCPVETHRFFLVKPGAMSYSLEENLAPEDQIKEKKKAKTTPKKTEPVKETEIPKYINIVLSISTAKYESQLKMMNKLARFYGVKMPPALSLGYYDPNTSGRKMSFTFKGTLSDFLKPIEESRKAMLEKVKGDFAVHATDFFKILEQAAAITAFSKTNK